MINKTITLIIVVIVGMFFMYYYKINNIKKTDDIYNEKIKLVDEAMEAIRFNKDSSIQLFQKAISAGEELNLDIISYSTMASIYYDKKDYKNSIYYYDKWISLDSNENTCYNSRGDAFLALGKYDEAIKDYTKSIEIGPQLYAYKNHGEAYSQIGENKLAINDFEKYVELYCDTFSDIDEVNRKISKLIKLEKN